MFFEKSYICNFYFLYKKREALAKELRSCFLGWLEDGQLPTGGGHLGTTSMPAVLLDIPLDDLCHFPLVVLAIANGIKGNLDRGDVVARGSILEEIIHRGFCVRTAIPFRCPPHLPVPVFYFLARLHSEAPPKKNSALRCHSLMPEELYKIG